MKSGVLPIAGGDYEHAGGASATLKELLKKIGAPPEAVRRAAIAAYEAEMNVVIHARRGVLRFRLNPGRLDLDVEDEGPGIPDIPRAMQEGFSTAPEAARKLGFGAGMGLPNIRRNSDAFEIRTTVGQGTRLSVAVVFSEAAPAGGPLAGSLHVRDGRCRQCLQCLFGCPTGALRVRDGRPLILESHCIECTACLSVCPAGALAVSGGELPSLPSGTLLVVPPALFGQFGPGTPVEAVEAALGRLGFERIVCLDAWEHALHAAAREHAAKGTRRPVMPALCPAAINLIEMRFPSLIPCLAPFADPLTAAAETLAAESLAWAVACPGQRTALAAFPGMDARRLVPVDALVNAVRPLLRPNSIGHAGQAAADGMAAEPPPDVLVVAGVREVQRTLEALEMGQWDEDVQVLELFLCDHGCFGSPLYREAATMARHRWAARPGGPPPDPHARTVRRRAPFLARAGVRLDPDMRRAIAKLGAIEELVRRLPGRDCGACGAPSCAALAEDVVLGRAAPERCPHRAAPPAGGLPEFRP